MPVPSDPVALSDLLKSRLWRYLQNFAHYNFQTTMFQPVGGMDMIGKAFAHELGGIIRYNAKVTKIEQGDRGVTVTYVDTTRSSIVADRDGGLVRLHHSALDPEPDPDRRRPGDEGGDRCRALCRVGQDRPAIQAPLLGGGRRDLWRHQLHGFADPADRLSEHRLQPDRPRRPARRLSVRRRQLPTSSPRCRPKNGSRARWSSAPRIHPQYKREFENGIAVAWHRVPFTLGCSGDWSEEARKQHYDNLCQIDGRIVLAGEHASALPAWQEGAILSALDAITRLHQRVVKA